MNTELFSLIRRLFKTLGVSYSHAYLKDTLKNELAINTYGFEVPDSILMDAEATPGKAWSDTLNDLRAMMYILEHYNVQASVNDNMDVDAITAPALVGIYRESGKAEDVQISYSWLVLHEKKGDQFHLFDAKAGEIILSADELKGRSTGISVTINKTALSAEPEYKRNKINGLVNSLGLITLGLFLLGIFSLAGYMGAQSTSAFYSLWLPVLVIKLIGLYVVIELKRVEANPAASGVLGKFCNLAEEYSCESVLQSKAAKILYGKISLSSIGLIYFLGGILTVFLAIIAGKQGVINVLAGLTVLSLPFTIYSIVYQWRVIKTWCVLCLAVQVLLWLEFLAYYLNSSAGFHRPDNTETLILLFGFLLAGIFNFFAGGYYKEKTRLHTNSALLSSWRRNTDIFKALMHKTPVLPDLPPFSIKIGSDAGKIEIVAVLGITCIHCKNTYSELQQLVNKRKDISLHIVPVSGPVFRDLLALTSRNKHTEAAQSLTSWYNLLEQTPRPAGNAYLKKYSEKLYSKWKTALQFDIKINESEITDQLKLQMDWFNKFYFSSVPKVFVNRKLWLIPPYQLNSIDNFFDELEESNSKEE